jgi:pyruvate ferredoxin oxidoreductase gamma subunit
MLAAVVKVSEAMDLGVFLDNMKSSFKHKFASKPEVIEGNLRALEMAIEEVRLYER